MPPYRILLASILGSGGSESSSEKVKRFVLALLPWPFGPSLSSRESVLKLVIGNCSLIFLYIVKGSGISELGELSSEADLALFETGGSLYSLSLDDCLQAKSVFVEQISLEGRKRCLHKALPICKHR